MKNNLKGWKLSIRDGDYTRLDYKEKSKVITEDEKEQLKQEIIHDHEKLGLDKNLKYELHPELFKR